LIRVGRLSVSVVRRWVWLCFPRFMKATV
jgi:hypothetical protein